ncbi:MAG: S8 family serine peptidase [Flavobacteriaceae bacterium]
MKKKIITFLWLVTLFVSHGCKIGKKNTSSQTEALTNKKIVLEKALQNYATTIDETFKKLVASNDPRIRKDRNGNYIKPNGISRSGRPIYFANNHGDDVYTNVNAHELKTGGSLGLNLNGQGVSVGVWDKGAIFDDHVEFLPEAGEESIISVLSSESQAVTDGHGTMVSSVIIAKGVYHNELYDFTGIAPGIDKLYYRNWTSVYSEAQQLLESDSNVLVSNHSYGYPIFDSETSEYNFTKDEIGIYGAEDQLIDMISNTHPYHLWVGSSGNEGDLNYPNQEFSGYSYLTKSALAKNMLTVGSVDKRINNSLPQATDFSSAGPTSDFRIKPEVVARGVEVPTAGWDEDNPTDNSAYYLPSGTSFSAPTVTGAVALLQELYHDTYQEFMLATTVKALLCHSATDITKWKVDGDIIGPDAKTGYGLINCEKAAQLIQDNTNSFSYIYEDEITNRKRKEIDFAILGDASKLVATLNWNDPYLEDLNSATTLINDLDLSIINSEGTEYPWILDSSNLLNPAIKGVNMVDNLEKVEIDNPSGTYTIRVSHKGVLSEAQPYSLIISTEGSSPLSLLENLNINADKLVLYKPNGVPEISVSTFKNEVRFISYKIYNLSGKEISSKAFGGANTYDFTIDTSGYPKGVYLIKIIGKRNVFVKKFVVN